jgi:hypothetical protein
MISDGSHPLFSSGRRRPVPIADVGPGLRREDKEEDGELVLMENTNDPEAFGRVIMSQSAK